MMKLTHTASSGLTLKKIEAYNISEDRQVVFWRHFDRDDRGVGPCYPTKAEALADTTAYAERAGWL